MAGARQKHFAWQMQAAGPADNAETARERDFGDDVTRKLNTENRVEQQKHENADSYLHNCIMQHLRNDAVKFIIYNHADVHVAAPGSKRKKNKEEKS